MTHLNRQQSQNTDLLNFIFRRISVEQFKSILLEICNKFKIISYEKIMERKTIWKLKTRERTFICKHFETFNDNFEYWSSLKD